MGTQGAIKVKKKPKEQEIKVAKGNNLATDEK